MQSKAIKILFISPLPPPSGGVATWTKIITDKGLSLGFDFRVVNTGILGKRAIFDTKVSFFWESCRTIRIVLKLFWNLCVYQPKVVHLNSSMSRFGLYRDFLLAKIVKSFGRKLVVHYRGDLAGTKFNQRSLMFLKTLLGLADLHLVLNEKSEIFLRSLITENSKKEIKIIKLPNFFLEKSIVQEEHKEPEDSKRPLKVIFVGGLALQKGIKEIVEIATQLPNIQFLLIGHAVPDTTELLEKLPDNLKLAGSLPKEAVFKELVQADVFLFPSHTEGFPNAVTEAMAHSLPVIATNVGAIPEMIDENLGGFLFNVGDVDGMMRALIKLEADRDLCLKMGEHNREKAFSKYAYSEVIKQLTDLYKKLMTE